MRLPTIKPLLIILLTASISANVLALGWFLYFQAFIHAYHNARTHLHTGSKVKSFPKELTFSRHEPGARRPDDLPPDFEIQGTLCSYSRMTVICYFDIVNRNGEEIVNGVYWSST